MSRQAEARAIRARRAFKSGDGGTASFHFKAPCLASPWFQISNSRQISHRLESHLILIDFDGAVGRSLVHFTH